MSNRSNITTLYETCAFVLQERHACCKYFEKHQGPTHCLPIASLDIELLYTNISFDMTIDVILKIFENHLRLVLYLDLIKFVLKNNIFSFSGNIYHQLCGIAMGTTAHVWRPPSLPLLSPTMRNNILLNFNSNPSCGSGISTTY